MQNYDHHEMVQRLLDCVLACGNCAIACLHEEDVKSFTNCIRLTRDCSYVCMQAAQLLQRDSVIAHQHLELCADICRLCAVETMKFNYDFCQQCSEACFACAEICQDHHQLVY